MGTIPRLVGASPALRQLETDIIQAARTDAKVLVTGESGVGKEVVARSIHARGRRAGRPLITINCAGVPDSLLASELFGHTRGAFTDAHADSSGWLEQADRGTVFLDEVGEMSQQMQALLLRFLENGEIQRVGSDRRGRTKVDVRVITATNRPLLDRVRLGEFRQDLFYRLNVIHLEVPPLRERREDVPPLLDHFLGQYCGLHNETPPRFSSEAMDRLVAYEWPGNVRELRNVVERLVVRSETGTVEVADLPREIVSASGPAVQTGAAPAPVPVADVLFERMLKHGESFWTVVHEPFMARDITRADLRIVVRRGLELTRGSYKSLLRSFNMPVSDYKRFLNFLRKHQSHLPIQRFRTMPARLSPDMLPGRAAARSWNTQ